MRPIPLPISLQAVVVYSVCLWAFQCLASLSLFTFSHFDCAANSEWKKCTEKIYRSGHNLKILIWLEENVVNDFKRE